MLAFSRRVSSSPSPPSSPDGVDDLDAKARSAPSLAAAEKARGRYFRPGGGSHEDPWEDCRA